MEGKLMNLEFMVVEFKFTGLFHEYPSLIPQAEQEARERNHELDKSHRRHDIDLFAFVLTHHFGHEEEFVITRRRVQGVERIRANFTYEGCVKTEPAFARVLKLEGDPYERLLALSEWSDEELLKLWTGSTDVV